MSRNKAWGAGGSGGSSLSPLELRLIEEWTTNEVTYYGDPDAPIEGDVKIALELGDLNGYRYQSGVWVLKSTIVGDSIYTDRFVCEGNLFKGLYNGEDSMVRLATTVAKTLVTGDTDYNQLLTGVGDLIWVESDGILEHSIPQPLFDEEVTTDFMEFWTDPSEYEKVIQSKFMVSHATETQVKMRWTAHLDVAKTNLIYESCTEFDYLNSLGQCMLDITTGIFPIEKPLYLSDLGGDKVYYTIFTEFPITYKGHTVDPGGANEQYYPYNEQWDYNAVGKIVAMQDWVDEYSVMKDDTDTTEMQFVSINPDLDVDPTLLGTREVLKQYIDNAVSATLEYKGGYDASLNIPNLTISPTGVLLGWFYTVTVAGTFFTTDVLVGDALIAEVDDPTVEADWTILNRGLDAATVKSLYESNPDTNEFDDAEKTKLGTVLANAEPNNISDIDATDLTDLGDTAVHYHATDRSRSNHTGTQTASTISDFDTEVTNNTEVTDNTTHRSSDGKNHSDVVLNNTHRGDTNNPHTVLATQITDFDTEVSNNTDVANNTTKASFPEAPLDGKRYERKDGGWVEDPMDLTDEPTGFLLNSITGEVDLVSSEISFDDGTRTFTIQPKLPATEFSIVQTGELYTFNSAQEIIISDTEGIHYIYFNNGSLTSNTSFDIGVIYDKVFTCVVYWDVPNQECLMLGDERHGSRMDGHTHARLHQKDGTISLGGMALNNFDIGNGYSDLHAQFSVDAGAIRDEDITISRAEQVLTTGCPIFYKLGATGTWRREFNSGFSVLNTGSGRLAWNEYIAGTWQKTEVTNDDFVLYHIFASNDINSPFFALMGQAEYDKKGDAREGAITEINDLITTGLPFAEFVALGTVIYQTKDTYANSVLAKIVTTDEGDDYVDWRGDSISPSGGASAVEHNLLSGKQGGTVNEYYHITLAEAVKLPTIGTGADLVSTNNLSDLVSAPTARTNLNVDIAGTDNSTNVTLNASSTTTETLDLVGQEVEVKQVTTTTDGAMIAEDKLKLDNVSNNGAGDDWVSGLLVTEASPKDQTVDYGAGTYLINGIMKTIASSGNYDLENGYASVNHYSGMIDDQRAIVIICVDDDEVIKSERGEIVEKGETAFAPLIADDTVCVAAIEIKVDKNDSPKDISKKYITDTRHTVSINTDKLVAITADDTSEGFLSDKLSNNGNVQFTIENVGLNETLKASALPEVYYAESLADSTTNSDTYQNKASMTETFVAGDYFIDVFYNWWSLGDRNDFMSQVTIGGVLQGVEHIQETKEKSRTQHAPVSRRFKVSLTGIQTINIDYKTSTLEAATVGMNSAMITVTKVTLL